MGCLPLLSTPLPNTTRIIPLARMHIIRSSVGVRADDQVAAEVLRLVEQLDRRRGISRRAHDNRTKALATAIVSHHHQSIIT